MYGVHVVGGSNPLAPTKIIGESLMKLSSMEPAVHPAQKSRHARALNWLTFSMCAVAALFYCYEYYLRVAPSVMAPELKAAFNLSDAAFGNLAACYYYAYTPMQIPVGLLLDRFGPRKTLSFACLICALGTYVFAATNSLFLAQLGRFAVGFGSAFAFVGVLKITDEWLPKKYFAFMAGLATTLGILGAIFGVLTMAALVDTMGWQATLNYSVVAGLILTVILWLVLKDKDHSKEQEIHEDFAHSSYSLLRALIKMFRNKEMWINGAIGCLTFLPISAFAELWAVPFLETAGFDKRDAAWGSSMLFLGFAVGGPCFGILSDFLKSRRIPLILGPFIAAFLFFLLINFPSTSKLWMYSLLFWSSFFASAEILVFAVSNDQNPKGSAATAAAFTNMLTMIGGAFLPPVIGKILDMRVKIIDNLPVYDIFDYTWALMAIPVGLLLASLLSYILKESYKKEAHH